MTTISSPEANEPSIYERLREEWIISVLAEGRLTPGQRVVLVQLAAQVDQHPGLAWPSAQALADGCNVSLSVARKAMRIGKQLGYLPRTRH